MIYGQDTVIDDLLTAFIAGGHVLLEGVPGVAKTLMVRCLARTLGQNYSRIQFTPDLMPADVMGVNVFEPSTGAFSLKKGPLFTDFLLADEVNRAPAKTQSAMLEAMQEKQVTIDGASHLLSANFMVVATQNPLDFEGTYPLPEAQLDRFLMMVLIGYPSEENELEMLQHMNALGQGAHNPHHQIAELVSDETVSRMREAVHQVEADPAVIGYVASLVRQTRQTKTLATGASPRAGLMLLHAAKARALMSGLDFVRPEDIQSVTTQVLRHRITLTPEAQIEGQTPDSCLRLILRKVPVPR